MAAMLAPPPVQTLSEWADENRVLSSESSAEQGKWRTSRTEYLRGIMDALADPAVQVVSVMKPAQVGWTEVINNAVGYYIDRDPSSILTIQPTVKMAENWSKKRLTPMLRDTPVLRGKIKDAKSRDSDNTILEKGFPGGYLAIVGANTPNDLASRPVRIVLADEVDKYPPSAGDFGDPISLALSRQNTFWNRKTLIGSTPGHGQSSTVLAWYKQGDQRKFHVPCPHCDTEQVMRWERIVWDKDETGHKPETARYLCDDCGCLWTDAERMRAVEQGRWIATAPFNGIASFHITIGLSPWVSMEQIVRKFLAAKDFAPRLRQWVNEVKGDPWEERGEASSPDELAARAEAYDDQSLPEAVRFITAGVDTQDDRLEYSLIGWGDGEEAWVIRHEVLTGDPGKLAVWSELDAALKDTVCVTEDGRSLRVRSACVDSGGHFGSMVLSFARARTSRKIYATKGIGNDHRGSKPIWGKAMLRTKNAGDRLWAVGVDTAKDGLQARLRIVPGEERTPKAVHFPMTGLSADYFQQLTSEMVVTELTREGRLQRKWKMKPGHKRNEALDCFILAEAAMLSLPTRLMRTSYTGVPVADPDPDVADDDPQNDPIPPVPVVKQKRNRQRWGGYS
ncbi:phage terminase large subunit family protein [Paracoccus sp. 22332]|uniref:phage terminase large subunit family protein n=1 Tax=Paracoccus sp. 22332 TaxID=3453913 RepID=UPI003F869599